jgi:hypothetical protein
VNHESRFQAIHNAVFLAIIGLCALGSGCRHNPTIWTAEVRSPDGQWLAIARTDQEGGFGSAFISTMVYLKQTNVSQPPEMVLAFDCEGPAPRPYVLDNTANAGGTINLTMKWLTPSHLELTYNGHATLSFQAIKCAGINISVRDVSTETSAPRS